MCTTSMPDVIRYQKTRVLGLLNLKIQMVVSHVVLRMNLSPLVEQQCFDSLSHLSSTISAFGFSSLKEI